MTHYLLNSGELKTTIIEYIFFIIKNGKSFIAISKINLSNYIFFRIKICNVFIYDIVYKCIFVSRFNQ